jgi:hypothetical protein
MSTQASKKPEGAAPAPPPGRTIEWAKIAVLPLITAIIGYFFTEWQKERDNAENNIRLYTQLISQREQSDSVLRTEMFKAVLEKFLSSGAAGNLRDMILKLELLSYNFHESLDLGPLFKEVHRTLEAPSQLPAEEQAQLRKRLDAAAQTIVIQQSAALSLNGLRFPGVISQEDANSTENGGYVIDEQISESDAPLSASAQAVTGKAGTHRLRLTLEVLSMPSDRNEVEVRLVAQEVPGNGPSIIDRHFSVSPYDFPMLDNTRMPNGDRCAVVITNYYRDTQGTEAERQRNSFVKLEMIVFPATSASLKERIEYDELLKNMLRSRHRYEQEVTP